MSLIGLQVSGHLKYSLKYNLALHTQLQLFYEAGYTPAERSYIKLDGVTERIPSSVLHSPVLQSLKGQHTQGDFKLVNTVSLLLIYLFIYLQHFRLVNYNYINYQEI